MVSIKSAKRLYNVRKVSKTSTVIIISFFLFLIFADFGCFHQRQFEMYAADILDLYFADNEEKTMKFLNEKSILYPDQQAAALIDDLCSKTLVSSDCMQSYMNRIWYGNKFHQNKNFTWEILVI